MCALRKCGSPSAPRARGRHWTSTSGGWYVANGDEMPLGDTATPGDALPSPKLSPLLSLSSTVSGIAIGTVAALAGRSLTGEGPVDGGGIETYARRQRYTGQIRGHGGRGPASPCGSASQAGPDDVTDGLCTIAPHGSNPTSLTGPLPRT